MPSIRTSRELAQRVDRSFHTRRNRLRRWIWLTALVAGLGCVGWLATAALRGQQQIYSPGPLSTSHQMLSDNCSNCHSEWAAWERLTTLSEDVRSIPNKKCVSCHQATQHHAEKLPAHEEYKCSACHGEHRGDVQLARIANRHCIRCHSNLQNHGGKGTFAQAIGSFDGSSGAAHPEFALHRQTAQKSSRQPVNSRKTSLPIYCQDSTDGNAISPQPQNPDAARLRFNHKAHLVGEDDSTSASLKNPKAYQDSDGNFLTCHSCHQADASGQYMLPIRYEQHCASCHPLLFDNGNYPGKSVPHEPPCVVRGFLTEQYTLKALSNPSKTTIKPPSPLNPGSPFRGLLTEDLADQVKQDVLTAEKQVLHHTHTLFGKEAGGGCRYCHTVSDPGKDVSWGIVPTQIPDRWYPHSRFRHHSHRMLNCNACHRDFSESADGTPVANSKETADVLIPPISICLNCHTSYPQGANALTSIKSFTGARTNCVECHTYHHRDGASRMGKLGIDLQPIDKQRRQKDEAAR